MTDLSVTTRAYLMGRCLDDHAMVTAVVRVIMQGHSDRTVAREERVPRRSLQRRVRDVRLGLNNLISGGHAAVTDLIAKE